MEIFSKFTSVDILLFCTGSSFVLFLLLINYCVHLCIDMDFTHLDFMCLVKWT